MKNCAELCRRQTHDKILKLETQINRVESILLVSVGSVDLGYGVLVIFALSISQ